MKKTTNSKVLDKGSSQKKISSFFVKKSSVTKQDVKSILPVESSINDLMEIPKNTLLKQDGKNNSVNRKRSACDTDEDESITNSVTCYQCHNKEKYPEVGTSFTNLQYSSPSKHGKVLCSSCTNIKIIKHDSLLENSENEMSPEKTRKSKDTTKCIEGKPGKCHVEANNLPSDGFNNDESYNLFDDDWAFELNLDSKPETLDLSTWQYCTVLEIQQEKELFGRIIYLESIKTKEKASCLLQVPWEASRIGIADFVQIKAIPFASNKTKWVVNGSGGLLVTNPDNLISGTSIVGSLFCARKGVLSDLYKGIDCDSKIMTVGSLVHELFQSTLNFPKLTKVDIPYVENLWKNLLKDPGTIAMLYKSQMSTEEASTEIFKFLPRIVQFVDEHINKNGKKQKSAFSCTIDSILDIEENLWMPQLGIKGKIDVTVQVKLHNRKKSRQPLELKTGRASFSSEHRGQLILYIMMMRELGYEVNSGLLLYLKEGTMKEIVPTDHEMRGLIMLRNEMNYFLTRKKKSDEITKYGESIKDLNLFDIELPPPINHHSACGKCPYLTLCSTYLRLNGEEVLSDNPLKSLSNNTLLHLSDGHISYFKKWTRMLLLEENHKTVNFPNSQLWTSTPEEREVSGKSLANLKIEGKVVKSENSYIHCFNKKDQAEFVTNLVPGDYVIISTNKQFNIIAGYVQTVTNIVILVSLGKDITINFGVQPFHIDLYDSNSLLSFNLTNLGVLLDDTEQTNRLRKLIIEKQMPEFNNLIPKSITQLAKNVLGKLNIIQQKAVLKVLTAKDYLLIQGMPGTGKTQTVVSIIKLMVSLKKSVLITSHTHSAVDNVLLKLHADGVDFLRLGSKNRIHPDIQEKSEESFARKCSTVEEIEKMYAEAMIVGVTCLGSAHALLSRRRFDICIVDESTQVLQCSVLRPLFSADKFVLIGDPEQLAPVVKNKEARSHGFDESLFKRLSDTGATVMLTMQYRMNAMITDLINRLTYAGLLECADDRVGRSTMDIKNPSAFAENYSSEHWLCDVLSSRLEDSVKFVDTSTTEFRCLEYRRANDRCDDREHGVGNPEKRCDNICEAAIVVYILNALVKIGINPDAIGVIAPYRDQVDLLRRLLHDNPANGLSSVEANTVDQYQGRDKDIVLYSCTKSYASPGGPAAKYGEDEILNDKRRLTVALTRSKQKLIIVGDVATLTNYKPFKELLSFLDATHVVDLTEPDSNFSWNCVFDEMDNSQKETDITML